jgi:hypothetical protein
MTLSIIIGRRIGADRRSKRLNKLLLTASICGFVSVCVPSMAQTHHEVPSTAATRSAASEMVSAEAYGRALLERGDADKTVVWLKSAIERYPESKVLRYLLARAYLKDGNDFWALRTLRDLTELYPEDCEPWLWIAWIALEHSDLDDAREALSIAACGPDTVAYTRQMLLLSMLEHDDGSERSAQQQLASARKGRALYREDSALMERLVGLLDPGYQPPISIEAEVAVGWSSNARAGSPTDAVAREQDASSPVGQANIWSRFLAPTGRLIRPSLELEARALGFSATSGRDLSYVLWDGRPGFFWGDHTPTGLLAYRYETLLLAGGDSNDRGPIWYYQAHRGELELNLSSLSFYGGVGRRLFKEIGRSRTEFDSGGGGSVDLGKGHILGALTARYYDANNASYNLLGGSLLISGEARLPANWSARIGALTSLDTYPDSAGYFERAAPKTKRRDVLLKLSAGGFSPPFTKGLKVGVTYEYSELFSTTRPYDYRDHRVLLKLLGNLSVDPWLPTTISPADHVPMDYRFESSDLQERVPDLLRRVESIQRSTACVETVQRSTVCVE